MPSLQALAAAALLQSPNRRHSRGNWHNKRHVVLTQIGFQPIVRTRRNRRLWDTGELIRMFPDRIPDMVIEEIQFFDRQGNPPRIMVGIACAAPVFTAGRILRLTEDPHFSQGCHAGMCNCGVELARRVHNSIDQVPFDEVVWRTDDSVPDIENRHVDSRHLSPEPIDVVERNLLIARPLNNLGARTSLLEREDVERNPPPPPPPLRRSSRKRRSS